jgi:hypothetical protein
MMASSMACWIPKIVPSRVANRRDDAQQELLYSAQAMSHVSLALVDCTGQARYNIISIYQ